MNDRFSKATPSLTERKQASRNEMTCELFQTLHDALPALMGDTSHPASFPAAAELVVQALQVHHLPLALRLVQLLTADAATDTDTDTDTDINTNTNTNTNSGGTFTLNVYHHKGSNPKRHYYYIEEPEPGPIYLGLY